MMKGKTVRLPVRLLLRLLLVALFFFSWETVFTLYLGRTGATACANRPHPLLRWQPAPGYRNYEYANNARGLRDDEIPVGKAPGELRVMILGDSSAWGFGVPLDRSFGKVLQKKLRERFPGRAITVVNGAVQGYSSYQGLVFWDETLAAYRPDVLVVSYLHSDSGHDWVEAKAINANPPWLQKIQCLLYRSNLYLLAAKEMVRRKVTRAASRPSTAQPVRTVSPEDYRKNLARFAAVARERGMGVVFLLLPQNGTPGGETSEGDHEAPYRAIMRETAASTGAALVDATPLFAGKGAMTLFLDDVHPAAAGHALIAGALLGPVATLVEGRSAAR